MADKDSHFKMTGQSHPEITVKAGEPLVLRISARKGKTWTGERVQDTLSNPVYAGRVCIYRRTPQERTGPGSWEPIVDPETFDHLGVKHSIRSRHEKPGRPTKRYALSGLAVCDRCGSPMYGRTDPYTRKDGTQRRNYFCRELKHKTGACDAPRPRWSYRITCRPVASGDSAGQSNA